MPKRKNNKIPKEFYIDFIAAAELFQELSQIELLCEDMSRKLFEEIKLKGYKPISKPRVKPYAAIDINAPKDSYRISIKAIYVGKKKAEEAVDDFKKTLYGN